jgi:hypothetical protein
LLHATARERNVASILPLSSPSMFDGISAARTGCTLPSEREASE